MEPVSSDWSSDVVDVLVDDPPQVTVALPSLLNDPSLQEQV